MASRFGPDADQNIEKNWRTVRKHMLLDQARASRDPFQDWLEKWFPERVKPGKPQADAPHLDWNLKTGGFGSVIGSPAKYNFDLTANNCNDVIYFTVDQPGGAAAVNVIAITNPYGGCPGNAAGATPTVKFGIALPFGTATSAVPSFDGKVLYVIESRPSANGGMILHAINVNNITSTPGAYNFGTTTWTSVHTLVNSPIGTPTSEQMFEFTYAGVTNNVASPYLEYNTNDIFFGDSAGKIHRVTGANTAAAAKYLINGFPVACGTTQVQSPLFYGGQVVTGSTDGKIYRINTERRHAIHQHRVGTGRRRRGDGRRRHVGAGARRHQQQDHFRGEQHQRRRRTRLRRVRPDVRGGREPGDLHAYRRDQHHDRGGAADLRRRLLVDQQRQSLRGGIERRRHGLVSGARGLQRRHDGRDHRQRGAVPHQQRRRGHDQPGHRIPDRRRQHADYVFIGGRPALTSS